MAARALRPLLRRCQRLHPSLCRPLSAIPSSEALNPRISSLPSWIAPTSNWEPQLPLPMQIMRSFSSDAESGGEFSEKMFHSVANDTLDSLQEKIEAYGEDLNVDGFDLDYSDGVMTIQLGDKGTYVLNKQTPNRQIWLSSPVSGPARFDWMLDENVWVYRRNKTELVSLMEQELSKLLGSPISLQK